ncbi:hypothetical protein [uncultured Selenomonas sp.]|uniref:hypothetical protein n=1 Tax=uncultured Selenomonas sp. TaxID=159275 RepID=UPI0028E80079|nr:hypothetical protein [uncultured Selenomonas sp.]
MWMMFSYGKQIAGIAFGVSLLGSAAAEAAVPQDALVVGGIEYGASESYVRSVYGAPREVETKFDSIYAGGQGVEWEYGSDFDIVFVNDMVRRVEIGARNGIQTKDGIAVGSDVNALVAAYGQPDAIRGDKYIYYVDGDASIGFSFEIENGRVDEINMGLIR